MISKTQFVRYALAAASAALPVGHAIATDNYIRLYTFTPPLAVDRGGTHNDLIVTQDSVGLKMVGYSFSGNAGNYNDIVLFTRTAEEFNAIYSESDFFCWHTPIDFPPPPYLGLTATTMTTGPFCGSFGAPMPTYTFKVEGWPVTQILASDGSSFDALPLVVSRDGKPWQTYYFASLLSG